MVRRAPLLLFALLGACAGTESTSLARLETQVRQLREEQERQSRQLAQFTSRVTLAEDTVRQSRSGAALAPAARGTVRIAPDDDGSTAANTGGGAPATPIVSAVPGSAGRALANAPGARPGAVPAAGSAHPPDDDNDGDDSPPANAPGARPSIRLTGREGGPLPNAPPITLRENERLPLVPVAPMPADRPAGMGARPDSNAPVPALGPGASIDPAAVPALSSARDPQALPAYERALELARGHQCAASVEAFSAFLVQWPDHPYAPNAMFWRGACILDGGEPARAAREFEGLLTRFPTAPKAPDALYKLVQCYRRLGERTRARASAERLLRDFPSASVSDRLRTEGMP